MIMDKAVYRDGIRHECGDPSDELDRLRAAADRRSGATAVGSPAVGSPSAAAAGHTLGAGQDDAVPTGSVPQGSAPTAAGRRAATNAFLWVGLKDPTQEEFDAMSAELGLHPLAVEDAMSTRERAKVDIYDETVVMVLKTLRYIERTSDVETGQIMVFLGPHYVLTIRFGELSPLQGIRRRLEAQPAMLAKGPISVLHGVVDTVVDQYVAVDRELEQDVVEIEHRVFSDPAITGRTRRNAEEDVNVIYRLKREVLEFKRAASPLVQPLQRLVAGNSQIVLPKKLRPFFSDVLDHLLLVVEHAESHDALLSDILTAHLTQVSVQQNDDMRKISAWAAMAVFPTMIAGIYGMNFENMPELGWKYGYFAVLGFIAAVMIGLYIAFKRSKWL